MNWWEQLGGNTRQSSSPAGRSVWEAYFAEREQDDSASWTFVGEIDPKTGHWLVPPSPRFG